MVIIGFVFSWKCFLVKNRFIFILSVRAAFPKQQNLIYLDHCSNLLGKNTKKLLFLAHNT